MTDAAPHLPAQSVFGARCAGDGELALAVRHWTGGVRLLIGDEVRGFTVTDGVVSVEVPAAGAAVVELRGSAEAWAPLLTTPPPPFAQLSVAVELGEAGLDRSATEPMLYWQYSPAVERAIELLRPVDHDRPVVRETGPMPRHDAPVGRYVHVELGGYDHRIYYEEAGEGIPVLLQHTAGCHSAQWRHLFEEPAITSRFRLIAYDLPFHGKSLPPVGREWWQEEYRLDGALLRSVPSTLTAVLGLERPVFMGCSVGGLLALDLALNEPDTYRSVISLEGALKVDGDWEHGLVGLWSPQVSNHTKARMMESLCSPRSPLAYVKEVGQVYASGWPPAFLGDLYYYLVDFDLRDRAGQIDTNRVSVHILNGEHDWSGSVAHGQAAHAAIAGSTHTVMRDVGHFPMQENPAAFVRYLLPILEDIAGR